MKNIVLTVLLLVLSGMVVLFIWIGRQVHEPERLALSEEYHAEILSGQFDFSLFKSDSEWSALLTKEQFAILRRKGTEYPFTGALTTEKRKGTYYSAGCKTPLFRSEQKYDSGTGWPSFWAPIDDSALVLRRESDPGDDRIEVLDVCGNHLGHVFDDGPEPTGKRYCINSLALSFVPDEEE